ncbi:MAG: hypothetical protein ACT4R6_10240 [Gemmatimonadaceae bacterium]
MQDGGDLVRAMHAHYAGKWFRSIAITLQNTLYGSSGGQSQSTWREFLAVPGRQRIDYLPVSQGSGVLYVEGRIYSFVDGRQSAAQTGRNAVAVLVADVYGQPPDSTIRQLATLGFDLRPLRRDFWSGDRVWVVGGADGDTTSSQFWIDTDSLLVERVILRETRGARTTVSDVRFSRFEDVSGYPVAKEMSVYRDGRLVLRQDYSDVRVNVALPPELFDPAKFGSPPDVP